jgi:Uma2 family endonuclease
MSNLSIADPPVSVEEYLAGEPLSEIKHEYLGGVIYAMAGASEAHNIISANLLAGLVNRLRGKACRAFGADMKVRLKVFGESWFYYPDAMISCDPADAGRNWRERPAALFEIVSERTRRIDAREKRMAYLQLPSLEAYVRLEQIRAEVVVDLRSERGWTPQVLSGLSAVLKMPSLGIEAPLAGIYDGVEFAAAAAEERADRSF